MAILNSRLWLTAAALLVVHVMFPSYATSAQSGMDKLKTIYRRKRSIDEALYGDLSLRAQQRRSERGICMAGKKDKSELVEDVVKSCNEVLSLNEQDKVVQRLTSDLRIVPITRGTFVDRALTMRKELGCDNIFQENHPQLSAVGDRSVDDVTNGAKGTATGKIVKQSSARYLDEEVYRNLLLRAQERSPFLENGNSKAVGNSRYSAEQNALLEDVVKTCTECLNQSGLLDVYQRLLSDLGFTGINRNTFNNRVAAVRKQMGVSRVSKMSVSCQTLEKRESRSSGEDATLWKEMLSVLDEETLSGCEALVISDTFFEDYALEGDLEGNTHRIFVPV